MSDLGRNFPPVSFSQLSNFLPQPTLTVALPVFSFCFFFPDAAPVRDQYVLIDGWPWIFPPNPTEKDWWRGDEWGEERRGVEQSGDRWDGGWDGSLALAGRGKDEEGSVAPLLTPPWWMLMSHFMYVSNPGCFHTLSDLHASKCFA